MLMPLTLKADPTGALIMLAGIYYGAQYGGSTTAILCNMPGEVTAVVTALDGHVMAKQGHAGTALGVAALALVLRGLRGDARHRRDRRSAHQARAAVRTCGVLRR